MTDVFVLIMMQPGKPHGQEGALEAAMTVTNPSVWEWRSARMEVFLRRVAEAAHSGGKELIVDVPVSWKDLRRHGKDSGLDYARVLHSADQIVMWNYFGVEQKSPEVSRDIVEDLLRDFPPDKFFVSVGLWRPHGTLDPQAFQKGLARHRIWLITATWQFGN